MGQFVILAGKQKGGMSYEKQLPSFYQVEYKRNITNLGLKLTFMGVTLYVDTPVIGVELVFSAV